MPDSHGSPDHDSATVLMSRICYRGAEVSESADCLSVEWPLHIRLNGQAFSVTMRTPGEDLDLVRGLFHSEGIAKSSDPVQIGPHEVEVRIPAPYLEPASLPNQQLAATSSCGLCGNQQLVVPDGSASHADFANFDPACLADLFAALRAGQTCFEETGGCHGVALFSGKRCLALAEDVGRHNAVDKVIGRLLAEDRLTEAECLVVSGRVSYEIIAKAHRADIPVVAAVSAPTSMAVHMARRFGIRLYAFCREGRATAYAGPEVIPSERHAP